MTANTAPSQAAPLNVTAGDSKGSANDAGQPTEFSSGIIPEKPFVDGANPPKFTATDVSKSDDQKSDEQRQQEGDPAGGAASNKSEKNKEAQAQRKGEQNQQAGWQQLTEALTKMNERMDSIEEGNKAKATEAAAGEGAQKKEGDQNQPAPEAIQKFVEGLEGVTSRLDRMEWERTHPEILTNPKLAKAWTDVTTDENFSKLTNDQKLVQAERMAGIDAKDVTKTLDGVIDQMQGGMPPEGGAAAVQNRNPAVDQETIEVGKVFGFTQQELEEEL